MTFDEAMSWCRRNQATWGFGDGPLGSGRRLWLRVEATMVEVAVPSFRLEHWRDMLTQIAELLRAKLPMQEASA